MAAGVFYRVDHFRELSAFAQFLPLNCSIAGENSDTRNRTFFRKATVKAPSTDWQASKGTTAENSQWIISGDRAWDYTNLGKPTQ